MWRGWGWLVPVGTFALLILVQLIVEALGGTYTGSDFWPGAALLVAGIANVSLGRRLNARPAQPRYDVSTHERVDVKPRHDFFFIRMDWWGILMVLGGLAILAVGAFS